MEAIAIGCRTWISGERSAAEAEVAGKLGEAAALERARAGSASTAR
jgi:hypothetical protein